MSGDALKPFDAVQGEEAHLVSGILSGTLDGALGLVHLLLHLLLAEAEQHLHTTTSSPQSFT